MKTKTNTAIDIKQINKVFYTKGIENKALINLDFSIMKGEIVGVIGANGSGKSTLLKIISGLIKPSSGQIVINGSITSILDIGSGFHPDLSGKENIFLKGELLGLSKKDISESYKKIVEFSEIEKFIDIPIKHYSNGMFLRLSFSISIHFNADILLLDEVLAVGDFDFMQKCKVKIMELSEKSKTIILVSHSINEISYMCNKVLLLDKGKVKAFGKTNEVVAKYINPIIEKHQKQDLQTSHHFDGSKLPIYPKNIRIKNANQKGALNIDEPIIIEFTLISTIKEFNGEIFLQIFDSKRNHIYAYGLSVYNKFPEIKLGENIISLELPANLLNLETYSIDFGLDCFNKIKSWQNLIQFKIEDENEKNKMKNSPHILGPIGHLKIKAN